MLSVSMITREAVCLLADVSGRRGDILYLETAGAGTKVAANSPRGTKQRHKSVDFIVTDADLSISIEDFSERFLHPATKVLWKSLEEDKIAHTHTLVLPHKIPCARHIYGGFCMRGMILPKVPEGLPPKYEGEELEKLVRLDVLFSRASDA